MIYGNLEVRILQTENDIFCEEYQDLFSDDKTTGRTTHHCISLPAKQHFQIQVRAKRGFEWHGADSLEVKVDFDEGRVINSYPVLMTTNRDEARPSSNEIKSSRNDELCQVMHMKPSRQEFGGVRAIISGFTVQRDDGKYQNVRFLTTPLNDDGDQKVFKHQGSIRVAVERIKISRKNRSSPAPMTTGLPISRASKDILLERSITTEISFDSDGYKTFEQRKERFFRTTSVDLDNKSVGVFVFHYRTPEVFREIKRVDLAVREQESHQKMSQKRRDQQEAGRKLSAATTPQDLTARGRSQPTTPSHRGRNSNTNADDDQPPRSNLSARRVSSSSSSTKSTITVVRPKPVNNPFETPSSASMSISSEPDTIEKVESQSSSEKDTESKILALLEEIDQKRNEQDTLKQEQKQLYDEFSEEKKELEKNILAQRSTINSLRAEIVEKRQTLNEQIKNNDKEIDDLKRQKKSLENELEQRKSFLESVKSRKRQRTE